MSEIQSIQTILYVKDQKASTAFYQKILQREADLNVPGMTEFIISGNCKLGLMPNNGIARILADKTPHPGKGNGIPRCELYLVVDDVQTYFEHAVAAGALLVSAVADRDWGDRACYFADADGHIIAFAEKL